jgi:hypothetical protein
MDQGELELSALCSPRLNQLRTLAGVLTSCYRSLLVSVWYEIHSNADQVSLVTCFSAPSIVM